ncbi:hypothetical protein GCK32_004409 [Trichostrongylus colubriformis]|uniref:Uncharacterized protein n=1 Tax=Trichostrongylus colubriformis TaxID=6319 RepID=A0AAN8IFG3_TRICO
MSNECWLVDCSYNNSRNWKKEMFEEKHIISEKTHEWPVTALIVVGITALILIVITFLFLMAKGGEKIVERRYNQKIPIQDHDIESL